MENELDYRGHSAFGTTKSPWHIFKRNFTTDTPVQNRCWVKQHASNAKKRVPDKQKGMKWRNTKTCIVKGKEETWQKGSLFSTSCHETIIEKVPARFFRLYNKKSRDYHFLFSKKAQEVQRTKLIWKFSSCKALSFGLISISGLERLV